MGLPGVLGRAGPSPGWGGLSWPCLPTAPWEQISIHSCPCLCREAVTARTELRAAGPGVRVTGRRLPRPSPAPCRWEAYSSRGGFQSPLGPCPLPGIPQWRGVFWGSCGCRWWLCGESSCGQGRGAQRKPAGPRAWEGCMDKRGTGLSTGAAGRGWSWQVRQNLN